MKFNKKNIIGVGVIILLIVVTIILFTSLNKKTMVNFKNPKVVTISGDKASINVTFDDNETNEFLDNDIKEIKSKNFKMKFKFLDYNKEQLDNLKEKLKKSNNFIIKDIKYNNYNGFIIVDNKTAYTNLYLSLNEDKNIVLNVKISATNIKEVEELIKKGTKAEDIVFNLKEVQQILSTIELK